jgi:hypothetical protein
MFEKIRGDQGKFFARKKSKFPGVFVQVDIVAQKFFKFKNWKIMIFTQFGESAKISF